MATKQGQIVADTASIFISQPASILTSQTESEIYDFSFQLE
ncbi:hypothetical protein [Pseudidiomarina terrestris]|nr:hypothetical protein [Pseudidiomarina sp. 1APR75-15]